MSALSRFPQGKVLDDQGYISFEWQEFLQNPEFSTLTVDSPISVASGGTGTNTDLLASLQMAGPMYPANPDGTAQVVCAIYAGNGVPNNAGGMNGDIYFQADGTVGSNLYKKVAGLWAAIL